MRWPWPWTWFLHDGTSAPDIERVLTLTNGEEPGRVVVRGAGRFGVPGRRQTTSPSVGLLDIALDLSTRAVERSLRAQLDAGAKLAVLCEPAVNKVYVSPRQMNTEPNAFDRLVMTKPQALQGSPR